MPVVAQPMSRNGHAPLVGVRVLDLTWAMAGPFCTLQLGLMGAQVIKVETAANLDGMRRGGLYQRVPGDPESSPTFNSLNLNKLGFRLNLKQPAGLALFYALVAVSDVVVENFRPGVLDRMGLGYHRLAKSNPTIIVASSSAFGSRGPESHGAGYASIFNAMSSVGHLTGYEDGPPAELRDSIDLRVGNALALSVLAALHHRQQKGEGQYIDVSSVEAIAALVGQTVVAHAMTGSVPARQGNTDESMAPHGVYPCLGDDQWVSIAVAGDDEFAALCRVMARPGLACDPAFADAYGRRRHGDRLDSEISAWTRMKTPEDATQALQDAGIAASPVRSNKAISEDPHPKARGVWTEITHPRLGRQTVQGLPWRTSASWPQVERPAPLLGQHNTFILSEVLGLSAQEIERLAETGVFD